MSFQDEMKKIFLRVAAGEVEPAEWEQWWNSHSKHIWRKLAYFIDFHEGIERRGRGQAGIV